MSFWETRAAERAAEEQKEENERVINETNEYARFIDELVKIFGGGQENVSQDTDDITTSSRFNDVLKNEKVKDLTNKFKQGQGKPLHGFYALVLQKNVPVDRATGLPREGEGGSAWKLALRVLSGYETAKSVVSTVGSGVDAASRAVLGNNPDASDISEEASENLKKLDFPEYYVFILANVGDNNPIPTLLEERSLSGGQRLGRVLTPFSNNPPIQQGNKINSRKFTNLDNYPLALITSKSMRDEEELAPGTLIRVAYDGIDSTGKVVVNEIIESDPEFVELVMRGFGAKALQNAVIACQQDSLLTAISHPTGDPIGTLSDVLTKTNIGGNNTIAYPFKENAVVNLVVILHGIYPYGNPEKTGQEIILSIVKEFDIKSTMFLIPKGTTKGNFEWSAIKQAIDDLTAQGITISSKRLAAWSAGVIGFNKAIQATPDGYWQRSFLADPSPSTNVFGSEFEKLPNGVYMEYNPEVWNSYPALKANFPKMAQKITSTGGQAVLKEDSHSNILKSILNKLNT
tara:strand:- start:1089 stop:2639 length:1551 start_codon:yes stop_codon:yes gene_type:complete